MGSSPVAGAIFSSYGRSEEPGQVTSARHAVYDFIEMGRPLVYDFIVTKQLREIEKPLANFFASGILAVRDKLGPFLWQFPPIMRFDAQRLEAFFRLLPRDTEEALALARRRDSRMTG